MSTDGLGSIADEIIKSLRRRAERVVLEDAYALKRGFGLSDIRILLEHERRIGPETRVEHGFWNEVRKLVNTRGTPR